MFRVWVCKRCGQLNSDEWLNCSRPGCACFPDGSEVRW
jgi:hypothetical protein